MSTTRQAQLMKLTTEYARRMNYLKNRIFGDVARPTTGKSMKVVKLMSEQPIHKNPEKTVDYYPRHLETHKLMHKLRDYGLYRDEHRDFQDEIRRLKILRGKKLWGPERWKNAASKKK